MITFTNGVLMILSFGAGIAFSSIVWTWLLHRYLKERKTEGEDK